MRRAFTLIELLVVITIIGLVSVLVLPGLIWAVTDRAMVSSVQALQGSLVEAAAFARQTTSSTEGQPAFIRQPNSSCGIRLIPSTTNPDSLTQVMPLITPPRYTEGTITMLPAPTAPGPLTITGDQTYWGWNIRLGDKISWGGKPYWVCGPLTQPNADLFVNYPAGNTVDYLNLVNGVDDNQNGYIDDGFDGLDNDANGLIDDAPEWEQETWTGPILSGVPYMVTRRPAVGNPTATLMLTVPVSITASQLNPGLLSGTVDVMLRPDGTVDPSTPYSSPSSIGLAQHQTVFAFVDTDGNQTNLTLSKTGLVQTQIVK